MCGDIADNDFAVNISTPVGKKNAFYIYFPESIMKIFFNSIQGKRPYQQDSIYAENYLDFYIFVVADGMGGHGGGEIASEEITKASRGLFYNFAKKSDFSKAPELIRAIINESQTRLKNIVEEDPTLDGLGSTVTIVLGYKNRFIVGNIGDSRTYWYNQGTLLKITSDHSLIENFRNETGSEPDPSMVAQYGHMLTRSVSNNDDEIDIYDNDDKFYKLDNNDLLLLCSDGLILDKGIPADQWLLNALSESSNELAAVNYLPEKALAQGSTDNISIIIGSNGTWPFKNKLVNTNNAKKTKLTKKKKSPPKSKKVFRLLIILAVIVTLSWIFFTFNLDSKVKDLFNSNQNTPVDTVYGEFSKPQYHMGIRDVITWRFNDENFNADSNIVICRNVATNEIEKAFSNASGINFKEFKTIKPNNIYEFEVMSYDSLGRIGKINITTKKIEE